MCRTIPVQNNEGSSGTVRYNAVNARYSYPPFRSTTERPINMTSKTSTPETTEAVELTGAEIAEFEALLKSVDPVRFTDHIGEVIDDRYEFLGLDFLKNGVNLDKIAKRKNTTWTALVLANDYDAIEIKIADTRAIEHEDEDLATISFAGSGLAEIYTAVGSWHPTLNPAKFTCTGGGKLLPGSAA